MIRNHIRSYICNYSLNNLSPLTFNDNRDTILYLGQGQCDIHSNGHTIRLESRELCIIPKAYSYSISSLVELSDIYCLHPDINDCAKIDLFNCAPHSVNVRADCHVPDWFQQLSHASEYKHSQAQSHCQQLTQKILMRISNTTEQTTARTPSSRLSPILDFMEEQVNNAGLSQEHIAQQSDMSVSYLKKIFKTDFYTSPMKYIQEKRMYKARDLLLHAPLTSIHKIAENCGYKNSNYFTRIFKKIHSKTPTEFRENIFPR